MKICFISAEAEPFAKSGGLGDVLGALPKALAERNEVKVIMPKYKFIPDRYAQNMRQILSNVSVILGWRRQSCNVWSLSMNGVEYYFIESSYYFGGDKIYDQFDLERFCFFSKAALEILVHLDYRPDVLHCNDWSTAIVPVMLDCFYMGMGFYRNMRTVITIHNLQYQGIFDIAEVMDKTGLPGYYFSHDKLEFYGRANLLKGGIVYANEVTTVSPSYAGEIMSDEYGEGLQSLMRARRNHLHGILNGVDYTTYNPETDELIERNYSVADYAEGKAYNKKQLKKQLGLPNTAVPLIGLVSRLYDQKGLDLITCVMEDIVREDLQMVILGTGDLRYEEAFRYYAAEYREKVASVIGFDNRLAHRIYAGCDLFLMPSRFEPCGLSQMISMKYGTLPIVREVGGLKDSVKSYNQYTGEGNGFSFTNYNAHDMLYTLRRALHFYYDDEKAFDRIIRNAMAEDYSWAQSAKKYESIYEELIN